MNNIVLNRENEHLAAIIANVLGKSVEDVVSGLLKDVLKSKNAP